MFNASEVNYSIMEQELETLVGSKTIFRIGEFYSLQNDHSLAERRRNGNQLASEHLKTACRIARFLYRFPYVKAIAVSGSLSKNFATDKTDIDFFIITAANRLWIARTCMHIFKKLTFLTRRQNWYCMNYYVDEEAMEIKEKNIFTAVEIVTLLPMHGKDSLDKFIKANSWTETFFPLKQLTSKTCGEFRKGLLSKCVEKIFSGTAGDFTDRKLMNMTAKRWQGKVQRQEKNSRGGLLGMSIDRHFSKPDPNNFQAKVIKAYQEKVEDIIRERKFSVSLVL